MEFYKPYRNVNLNKKYIILYFKSSVYVVSFKKLRNILKIHY